MIVAKSDNNKTNNTNNQMWFFEWIITAKKKKWRKGRKELMLISTHSCQCLFYDNINHRFFWYVYVYVFHHQHTFIAFTHIPLLTVKIIIPEKNKTVLSGPSSFFILFCFFFCNLYFELLIRMIGINWLGLLLF